MCECIKRTDEVLADKGLKLEISISFSMKNGSTRVFLPIHTVKLDEKNRKVKTAIFTPNYCPFCGEKQEPLKEE